MRDRTAFVWLCIAVSMITWSYSNHARGEEVRCDTVARR